MPYPIFGIFREKPLETGSLRTGIDSFARFRVELALFEPDLDELAEDFVFGESVLPGDGVDLGGRGVVTNDTVSVGHTP